MVRTSNSTLQSKKKKRERERKKEKGKKRKKGKRKKNFKKSMQSPMKKINKAAGMRWKFLSAKHKNRNK